MGVIRQRNGECDNSAVALAGTVAGLAVLMAVLSGCVATGHTSGHSSDVADSASALSVGVESESSDVSQEGSPRAGGAASGQVDQAGQSDQSELAVSDEDGSAAGSGSQQESDSSAPGARAPGGAVPGEGPEVVDSSGAAQGVDKYLVPLPGQADQADRPDQSGQEGGADSYSAGSSGSAGDGAARPAPSTQPSSTWQMPYRVVRYCGTVGTHEVGTSFFTDGTTGWTQKCLNQMAAAARASGPTLPQVSPAPAPASPAS